MAEKKNVIKTTVKVDSTNAEKGIDNVAKSADNLAKSNESAASSFDKLDDATGSVLSSFKALVTNPIGLTIAALAGIFKTLQGAVKRSGKASETFGKIGAKLSGIMNGFLAILEPVVEFLGEKLLKALNDPMGVIKELGESIKENLINRVKSFMVFGEAFTLLLQGKFKEAAKKGADAVTQLATGVENATEKFGKFAKEAKKRFKEVANATDNIANAEKRLAQNRIALEKQQLKSLKIAEELRQKRDDEKNSIEERKKANEELGKVLDEQLQKELALANQSLALARAKQKAQGATLENIEAVGDAEIKLLEIQERITGQRSEQLANENALRKEAEELKKKQVEDEKAKQIKEEEEAKKKAEKEAEKLKLDQEAQNELDLLEIERKREQGEKTLELELALLEKKRLQDVSAANLTAKQIQLINEKAELAKAKVRKISENAEKAKEKAILDNVINSAAEAFGITQEVAVAKMIMAAPEAVAGSFKEAAKSYAPPFSLIMGALGAAGTVAPIIKGLADIKKARFSKAKGGSKGGNISASAGAGGGGSAPSGITSDLVNDIAANNASRLGVDTDLGAGADATASARVSGGASSNVVFSENRYRDFQRQVEFKEEKSTIT